MRVRTNRLTISIALLTSLLLSPVGLAGQTPNAPTGDWSRLSAVTAGSKLSVKQKNGKTVEGKLIAVSDAGLSLSVKGKPVDVKREEVSSVSQTTRKSATKATLIGLGVGAGAGAGIGLAGSNNDNFDKINHVATAGLAVLGAGAGALVGYMIGKSGRKQVVIYQAGQP
jgi:hypothetical protein